MGGKLRKPSTTSSNEKPVLYLRMNLLMPCGWLYQRPLLLAARHRLYADECHAAFSYQFHNGLGQIKKTVLAINHDGKCFEHLRALSELYCKNNCALKKILNKQLFCNCPLQQSFDLIVLSDRLIEKPAHGGL